MVEDEYTDIGSDDRDSALGDDVSLLTMSVTSSVYNYRYEHGRRYHAYSEGKYLVPNDEPEKDRLDLQHHTFRLTADGALYIAPISKSNVQNVLDVGTGTGIWAIEFAEEHPQASVLGTDLSPIQPELLPPNCSFLIDDADHDWIFHQPFDFIHARAMMAAFKDWPRFLDQSFTNLKPGGYLELQEFHLPPQCLTNPSLNVSLSSSPAESPHPLSPNPIIQWGQYMSTAGSRIGLDFRVASNFGPLLQSAGFVDIHATHFKWPYGPWAKGEKMKMLGRFAAQDLEDGLQASVLGLFTKVLGWTREEVEVFLSSVRKEIREGCEGIWQPVVFWYARRPLPGEAIKPSQTVTTQEITLEPDENYLTTRRQVREERTMAEKDVERTDSAVDAQPSDAV
ncbi:S-adenosyl-L-methionine-dependent methyltransferase [Lepidopterella palustris CBS 459.81]|uniref:S-adenosyl-L-methionine-dependent methyltransferase n=1 Tax=Lepidopterella palustris CBS 459.81 TaxID=1314670 RepID=A0A8E2JGY8_9PEZI|nr:S-adenosyl-L-methionine-dependent methyltransferase [Lepidopterella palustris CBS 459.81]